jgi:hypothetical protein
MPISIVARKLLFDVGVDVSVLMSVVMNGRAVKEVANV